MGCVFPMVFVSILPQAEFGPDHHRESASHFMTTSSTEFTPVLIPLFADLFLDRFIQSIRAFGSHFLAKFLQKINRNDSAEKHFWEMVCTGEFQSYSNKSLLFFPLLSLSNYLKKLLKIRNMIYFWVTEIKPYQMAYRKSLSNCQNQRGHITYVT